MKMASYKFIFSFFMIILCSWSPLLSYGNSNLTQPKYLVVPVSEFLSSLKFTINTIQNVTSTFSQLSIASNDFRLSNAISVCLDLLDLSAEVLDWTLSPCLNPDGISWFLSFRFSKNLKQPMHCSQNHIYVTYTPILQGLNVLKLCQVLIIMVQVNWILIWGHGWTVCWWIKTHV